MFVLRAACVIRRLWITAMEIKISIHNGKTELEARRQNIRKLHDIRI